MSVSTHAVAEVTRVVDFQSLRTSTARGHGHVIFCILLRARPFLFFFLSLFFCLFCPFLVVFDYVAGIEGHVWLLRDGVHVRVGCVWPVTYYLFILHFLVEIHIHTVCTTATRVLTPLSRATTSWQVKICSRSGLFGRIL